MQKKIHLDYTDWGGPPVEPGAFNPVPSFVSSGIVAGGVVLHFGRLIPLHVSVSAFNRKGVAGKCRYPDGGYYGPTH
jgi:hypothetical protein